MRKSRRTYSFLSVFYLLYKQIAGVAGNIYIYKIRIADTQLLLRLYVHLF